jgi:hypothetical protein
MSTTADRQSRSSTRAHGKPSETDDAEIAALITRLLSHFWTADDPVAIRRAQVVDWLDDLVEFGADAVEKACAEFRREQTRRPYPADIRKLCIAAQTAQRERLAHAPAARAADIDAYARSVGWKSEAERREAIRRDEAGREARWERARLVREELAATGSGGHRHASRAAAAALKANGVSVREEDPEELRKARIALGIEKAEAEAEKPPATMAAE